MELNETISQARALCEKYYMAVSIYLEETKAHELAKELARNEIKIVIDFHQNEVNNINQLITRIEDALALWKKGGETAYNGRKEYHTKCAQEYINILAVIDLI